MKRKIQELDSAGYLDQEERWRVLGLAIVKQAVADWREASRRLSMVDTHDMNEQKNSSERFLQSRLCELYSGLDGPSLLRKLKAGEI